MTNVLKEIAQAANQANVNNLQAARETNTAILQLGSILGAALIAGDRVDVYDQLLARKVTESHSGMAPPFAITQHENPASSSAVHVVEDDDDDVDDDEVPNLTF